MKVHILTDEHYSYRVVALGLEIYRLLFYERDCRVPRHFVVLYTAISTTGRQAGPKKIPPGLRIL
jgi:hypothetical protein